MDGRRAALVEAGQGSGLASHLLLAEAGAAAWQDVAVFEGRVEEMQWQGADLLLAFADESAVRVFSVFPGMSYGDRVRIEMLDAAGNSLFGAIDQVIARP